MYSSESPSYSTCNSFKNNLHLSRFSTARVQKSFKYIGAVLRNNFPQDIKQLSFAEFKIDNKNLLLEAYI